MEACYRGLEVDFGRRLGGLADERAGTQATKVDGSCKQMQHHTRLSYMHQVAAAGQVLADASLALAAQPATHSATALHAVFLAHQLLLLVLNCWHYHQHALSQVCHQLLRNQS